MAEKLEISFVNTQSDYFEYMKFEELWSMQEDRRSIRPWTIKLSIVLFVLALGLFIADVVGYFRSPQTVSFWTFITNDGAPVILPYIIVVLAVWVLFIIKSIYDYHLGYKTDYKFLTRNEQELKDKGKITFPDQEIKLEFLDTNVEQYFENGRTFLSYQDILYIQETDNLIIIRVDQQNKRKKNYGEFEKIIISKRDLSAEELSELRRRLEDIEKTYKIGPALDENILLSDPIGGEL